VTAVKFYKGAWHIYSPLIIRYHSNFHGR